MVHRLSIPAPTDMSHAVYWAVTSFQLPNAVGLPLRTRSHFFMVDDLFFLPLGELICTFYVSINLISLRELQLLLYIATVVFLGPI